VEKAFNRVFGIEAIRRKPSDSKLIELLINKAILNKTHFILCRASTIHRFVELLMLLLAIGLLGIWGITPNWPYLVLSLSFVIGSSVSILVRERSHPH